MGLPGTFLIQTIAWRERGKREGGKREREERERKRKRERERERETIEICSHDYRAHQVS
jgi:hypothetical protein